MYNLTMYDLTTDADKMYHTGVDLETAVIFILLFLERKARTAAFNLTSTLTLLDFNDEHCVEYHDLNIGIRVTRSSVSQDDVPHHKYQD